MSNQANISGSNESRDLNRQNEPNDSNKTSKSNEASNEGTNDLARKWQPSLKSFFFLILIAAVVLGTSRIWPVTGAWLLVGIAVAMWRLERAGRITLVAVILAVYLPYVWLLSLDYINNSYHRGWLLIWPNLPGLILSSWMGFHQSEDWVGLLVAAINSAVILGGSFWIGRRGTWWLVSVLIALLALSICNSCICYAFFRA